MKYNSRILRYVSSASPGFTLVEVLVVLALLSLVTGLLVTMLYQFWHIPHQGSAQLAIDHDLRNAGAWLMRDGNQSNAFTPGGTCGTFDTGRGVTYTYALNGTGLQRTDSNTGQVNEVAHYVTGLTCTTINKLAVVTIDVAKAPVSASTTFTVTMRVD
jgi:prepilin-type N-terminal cleavage/methylation domain-containing protein